MSLKENWKDRVDGVDDVVADDINAIAQQVIENEENIDDLKNSTKIHAYGYSVIKANKSSTEGTGVYTLKTIEGLEVGMSYSVKLTSMATHAGKIVEMGRVVGTDGGVTTYYITVDGYVDMKLETDENGKVLEFDDKGMPENYLTIVGRPDLGDKEVGLFASKTGENVIVQDRAGRASGRDTMVLAPYGDAGNRETVAGYAATSRGYKTKALGNYSIADGHGTEAHSEYQHVGGRFNVIDDKGDYADIIGNGGSDKSRKNIRTLDWKGNGWYRDGLKIGGESQDDPNAEDVRNVEVDEETQKVYVKVKNKRAAELAVKTYYNTYGVSIDLTDEDPVTAITYIDDAVGAVSSPSDWYNQGFFKDIKPCLFKDGKVVGYLKRDNYAKFEDDTDADITSGDAGNVMLEIPKLGYKITKNENDRTITVQVTNDPNKAGFSYMAHTRKTEGDRDVLYIGVYPGSEIDGKLCSLPYKLPTTNRTLSKCRELAQANGSGYDQLMFYPLTLMQCLYLIVHKNLNSQQAVGAGAVNDGLFSHTGTTLDIKAMDGSSKNHIKVLGIEDLWGNVYQYVDGIICDADYNMLTATDDFNLNGTGYNSVGKTSRAGGAIISIIGNNNTGFLAENEKMGTALNKHFTDICDYWSNAAPIFGGSYNTAGRVGHSQGAGIFSLLFSIDATNDGGGADIGCRLLYL